MTEVEFMDGEEQLEPLMTAEEAALVLRVAADWVYRAARNEVIPCVRLGPRVVRFRRSDIESFVVQGGTREAL